MRSPFITMDDVESAKDHNYDQSQKVKGSLSRAQYLEILHPLYLYPLQDHPLLIQ